MVFLDIFGGFNRGFRDLDSQESFGVAAGVFQRRFNEFQGVLRSFEGFLLVAFRTAGGFKGF